MDARTLSICTGARLDRAAAHVQALEQATDTYEINTPPRQAAFLAQIGHESGGLHWLVEVWGPTPAQKGYEMARRLGNNQIGDGYRYRGRSWIQLTGRANYKRYGDILGMDLERFPDLAAEPAGAALIAALYWHSNGCNELADFADFRTITLRINGGLNGYEERCALWEQAKEVLV